jgi:hypothetical protein
MRWHEINRIDRRLDKAGAIVSALLTFTQPPKSPRTSAKNLLPSLGV